MFNRKLVCLICFVIFAGYLSMRSLLKDNSTSISSITVSQNISPPIILQWNEFQWTEIFGDSLNCSRQCKFTKEIKYESSADLIIFHLGDGILKQLPMSKKLNRLNVMVNFEPPPLGPFFTNIPKDFFNFTVSYRLDSNLPMPYDCLKKLKANDDDRWSDEEVEAAMSQKNESALYLVSHCKTDSKREVLAERIKKYMNITQFGTCNKNQCPRDMKCEDDAIASHHFIFAFENSICLDYITEKLFRFRKLIVPVIMDRKILRKENAKLNPYVIAVSDFESVKEFTDYLKMLIKNKDKYKKYFEWTKLYKRSNKACVLLDNIACKMCDVAWDVKAGYQNIIPNIEEWYETDKCKSDFGKYIV